MVLLYHLHERKGCWGVKGSRGAGGSAYYKNDALRGHLRVGG